MALQYESLCVKGYRYGGKRVEMDCVVTEYWFYNLTDAKGIEFFRINSVRDILIYGKRMNPSELRVFLKMEMNHLTLVKEKSES